MKNHLNMLKQKKLGAMTLVPVEVGKNIRIVVLNNLRTWIYRSKKEEFKFQKI